MILVYVDDLQFITVKNCNTLFHFFQHLFKYYFLKQIIVFILFIIYLLLFHVLNVENSCCVVRSS